MLSTKNCPSRMISESETKFSANVLFEDRRGHGCEPNPRRLPWFFELQEPILNIFPRFCSSAPNPCWLLEFLNPIAKSSTISKELECRVPNPRRFPCFFGAGAPNPQRCLRFCATDAGRMPSDLSETKDPKRTKKDRKHGWAKTIQIE